MLGSLSETGCGRPIDLRFAKTVGQRGRPARISKRARTVVRVNQARIMQGRVSKERKPMAEKASYVGVDVAKSTLDLAVNDSQERWQFSNDDEGISQAVHCIADLRLLSEHANGETSRGYYHLWYNHGQMTLSHMFIGK